MVAGICDNPTLAFGRQQRRMNMGQERQFMQKYLQTFKPFDWTVQLEGGGYAE